MRTLAVVLTLFAAVAAIALANVVLLGYGSERVDRVGKLSPRAELPHPASSTPWTPQKPDARERDNDLDD
jgi:hypothetical protein